MGAKINFIKTALRDYRAVGAITPTSKYVITRIKKLLPHNTQYIVEYGAGDGVITRQLLRIVPSHGKVVAIEVVPAFVAELKEIRDERLYVFHHDVAELIKKVHVLGIPRVDAVISGIPFSLMNSKKRTSIVADTHALLENYGVFILYQTSPLMIPYLKKHFRKVTIRFEPRNFPPYFLIRAEK